ncbi:MAG: hypothetical protein ACREFI_08975 [Stellaceae bacterium]
MRWLPGDWGMVLECHSSLGLDCIAYAKEYTARLRHALAEFGQN